MYPILIILRVIYSISSVYFCDSYPEIRGIDSKSFLLSLFRSVASSSEVSTIVFNLFKFLVHLHGTRESYCKYSVKNTMVVMDTLRIYRSAVGLAKIGATADFRLDSASCASPDSLYDSLPRMIEVMSDGRTRRPGLLHLEEGQNLVFSSFEEGVLRRG